MKIQEIDIDKHYKETGGVLTTDQKKRGLLIYAFQQIQKEYNYLPEDRLRELSKKLDIPLADVYSAASFYKHFYFKPRGKNVVCVCMGTACHVRGASKVLHKLEEEFGVKEGETTPDLSMTIETVGCVGCCGLAPVVTVNEEVVGDVGTKKVNEIIKRVKTADKVKS
ncbi:MAG: NAD(P)H-dependent oxidoreductase subunit E [Nitrospirae bacterium]|nr:NAD(P)H-dependent oxidoreductase subunit E [Nitrospirota bacterium]MCL5976544.1 NAD(P)H-dependent oxidoreductase subunit E [Nitrospirota bacterium]